MTYVVTRGIGVAVVELISTLEAALERAGQLVSDNYANVGIHDGKGNRISGDDLLACYLGVMKLTPDLRAVEVQGPPSEQ
jgi:hypothetical protein